MNDTYIVTSTFKSMEGYFPLMVALLALALALFVNLQDKDNRKKIGEFLGKL